MLAALVLQNKPLPRLPCYEYNNAMIVFNGSCSKKPLVVALLLALFYTSAARADVMVRVEESFNGQLPMTALHWFGENRSTRDDGNRYVVTRLDQGKVYTIDRLAQSYKITALPLHDADRSAPDVRAIKLDETRTIGQWTAQKYEVIGAATAGMKIVIWASTDVDINLDNFRSTMTGLSRRPGSEWMAAYKDIDGFPVLQEVEMQHKGATFHGQTRAVLVEERKPPEHIYSPPDDFSELK